MIRPNDVVLHKPSGEKWVVAGVNTQTGELVPMGYPFPSIAKLSDCELLESHYTTEHQSEYVIKEFKKLGMTRFIDATSAMFLDML